MTTYTLTLSAAELEALRVTRPELADRAVAKRTPAKRAARKTSAIPAAVVREADEWAKQCEQRRDNPELQRYDNIILRDVIALHRGLPKVTA